VPEETTDSAADVAVARVVVGFGTDPLSVALGRLRALVGVQVGMMACDYDLQVHDDLATIVPDQKGWFFERFTD